MLKVERLEVSSKFTNMMSFHAGNAHGTLVLIDRLGETRLKELAMIGLEIRVREVLGMKCSATDLTPGEVSMAVEVALGVITESIED